MMKVFICWSGDRSRQVAAFLRDWLPAVHQNIEPFMSAEDIGKGLRWTGRLSRELEAASFGIVPILCTLNPADVQGPLSDFQSATALDDKEEMRRLLASITEAMGAEASSNWMRTFELLWKEVPEKIDAIEEENKIQITSPTEGRVLEDQREHQHLKGHTYSVRGTLKYLPRPCSIWLLNASNDGRQWPQEPARHDPVSGRWDGRIYLQEEQQGTWINAVVAPPTSQQFFEYYHRYGNANPLSGIPDECKNIAQVWAQILGSK
jgi:hypothetical protein